MVTRRVPLCLHRWQVMLEDVDEGAAPHHLVAALLRAHGHLEWHARVLELLLQLVDLVGVVVDLHTR